MIDSRKIAKVSGITLLSTAAAACTTYLTTNFLVKAALDRELPHVSHNADKIVSGAEINHDFMNALNLKSRELAERPNQEVHTTSYDEISLVGHYFQHSSPKRIIIAMHGWRSSWHRDFGMVYPYWEANGCSVLFAEQRGQSNSGGDYMGFGLTERFDCQSWINWVVENTNPDLPIYLAGVSMGATTVMMAAGLSLSPRVHGIMADCGFTSPDAIWRHVASDNLHLVYDIHRNMADTICRRKIQMGLDDYSTVEALQNSRIPLLLVHGANDHFVPVEMSYENYLACSGPRRIFIVPGADHGMSYYCEPRQYEETALRFWKDFDYYDYSQRNSLLKES